MDTPDVCMDYVFSYCEPTELLALDLTCHRMRDKTHSGWTLSSLRHFGDVAKPELFGKDLWRWCVALSSPSRSVNYRINDDVGYSRLSRPPSEGEMAGYSFRMSCNERKIVSCCDEMRDFLENGPPSSALMQQPRDLHIDDEEDDGEGKPAVFSEHETRNMRPVRYKECPSYFPGKIDAIVVCGPEGGEVVALSSGNSSLLLFQDDSAFYVNLAETLGLGPISDDEYCDIRMLGSEQLLILLCRGHVVVFDMEATTIASREGWPPAFITEAVPEYRVGFVHYDGMCWTDFSNKEFAFWDQESCVSIWGAEKSGEQVRAWHAQTVTTTINKGRPVPTVFSLIPLEGKLFTVTPRYVAGAFWDNTKVSVCDRFSGAMTHPCLFSSEIHNNEIEDFYPEFFSLVALAAGDILLVACPPGLTVNVWHMPTGKLMGSHVLAEAPCRCIRAGWLIGPSWESPAIVWCTTNGMYVFVCPWNSEQNENMLLRRHQATTTGRVTGA